ncbi:MAG: hypothetical protein ABL890_02230 [Candidatus Peribacteraceae bacterium]
MPAFTAVYLVGTILAAALLSLGWFLLLIVLHMSLDIVKYREVHGYSTLRTLKAVLLESASDIALLLTAITFAVYLHHTFLLSSVSGLMRSQLTIVRALGMLIPETSILQHAVVVGMNIHEYMHSPHPDIDQSFTRVEKWSLITIVVTLILLLIAVPFVAQNGHSVSLIIAEELNLSL